MKIVNEMNESERYLDITISPKEFDILSSYMLISKKLYIGGFLTHIGIQKGLDSEEYEEEE